MSKPIEDKDQKDSMVFEKLNVTREGAALFATINAPPMNHAAGPDLRREISSLGIRYPVVTDNDYQTWNAYKVEAWPTGFLLDKQGRIRWMHIGEGDYARAERLIQKLLDEEPPPDRKSAM